MVWFLQHETWPRVERRRIVELGRVRVHLITGCGVLVPVLCIFFGGFSSSTQNANLVSKPP